MRSIKNVAQNKPSLRFIFDRKCVAISAILSHKIPFDKGYVREYDPFVNPAKWALLCVFELVRAMMRQINGD